MTSVHGDALTAGPTLASTTTVDAAEALCFARDLGGSLTHVLVAAAGRALAADPVRTGAARPAVGLVIGSSRGADVAVLTGACDGSLPALRADVDAALRGAVDAPAVSPGDHPVAIVVVETDQPHPPIEELLRRFPGVLEARPCEGDPLSLALTLHADRRALDAARAEALLARIARLLARPYRRLQ